MWKSFYENSEYLELPLLSMFLFLITFIGASVLAWRRGGKDEYQASLPLQSDDSARGQS